VEKIIGDLWATGMDEAKIEAQGMKPIEGRLAEVDKLTDANSIARTCATPPRRAKASCSASARKPTSRTRR
jgi:predicted metalloendopeptidase